jgi:hypothetical protein
MGSSRKDIKVSPFGCSPDSRTLIKNFNENLTHVGEGRIHFHFSQNQASSLRQRLRLMKSYFYDYFVTSFLGLVLEEEKVYCRFAATSLSRGKASNRLENAVNSRTT